MALPHDISQDITVVKSHIVENFEDLDARAGAGSSDAATLEGEAGAYYLERANHTGTQPLASISDAGTAAALDIPASGNAAAGEVVKGNDTRLTDNRTPTAHAATHRPGGSDAIPTAAAAGLANANAEGASTSLSRADHTHKRDVRVASSGADVGTRNKLNFTGAGVSVTDDSANDRVTVDIPGGGAGSDAKVEVYHGGALVGAQARKLDLDADDFVAVEDAANDQTDISLADNLDSNARVAVRVNSNAADAGARRRLNLIEGTGISITAIDDNADEEIDVTIAATGGAGGGHTIRDEGSDMTARAGLDFIGDVVTLGDNAGTDSTDVIIDAIGNAGNVGAGGVGVFKQKTGSVLELKKINAGSSKIAVVDDAPNSTVGIDIVEANLSPMAGANGTVGGAKGLVPAPAATDNTKVLYGNGTWQTPPGASGGEANTTSNAGTGADGAGLVLPKSGVDLPLKRLKAGANITLNESANSVEIVGQAGGGGSADARDFWLFG